jgi:hypothetical protein
MGVPMEHDVGMLIVSFCGTLQIKSNQIKSNHYKPISPSLGFVQPSNVVLLCWFVLCIHWLGNEEVFYFYEFVVCIWLSAMCKRLTLTTTGFSNVRENERTSLSHSLAYLLYA